MRVAGYLYLLAILAALGLCLFAIFEFVIEQHDRLVLLTRAAAPFMQRIRLVSPSLKSRADYGHPACSRDAT